MACECLVKREWIFVGVAGKKMRDGFKYTVDICQKKKKVKQGLKFGIVGGKEFSLFDLFL